MSIESVLAKELENERQRSQALEDENMRLRQELKAFEESKSYPTQLNACIGHVKRYLKQHQKRVQ